MGQIFLFGGTMRGLFLLVLKTREKIDSSDPMKV